MKRPWPPTGPTTWAASSRALCRTFCSNRPGLATGVLRDVVALEQEIEWKANGGIRDQE